MTPAARRYALALGWTLALLVALSLPESTLPSPPLDTDKLAHLVLFGVFGWLWMRALPQPLPARTWWVLTLGLMFAGLTEVYQGILPWPRTPDLYDALANALGLTAGVVLFRHRAAT